MRKNLLLMGLLAISVNAFPGDKGNGGTVLDCGGKIGLADFEEIKLRPGLRGKIEIPESDEAVDVQIAHALDRLKLINAEIGELAKEELAQLKSNLFEVENEYEWSVTSDVGAYPVPQDCRLRNTILYIDNGPIEINMPLYRSLTPTHQAGIKVHEVVFKIMRTRIGENSAVPARRITAMLFAVNPDYEILVSLVTKYLAPDKNMKTFFVETDTITEPSLYFAFSDNGYSNPCVSVNSIKEYSCVDDPKVYLKGVKFVTVEFYKSNLATMWVALNYDKKPHRFRHRLQFIIQKWGINLRNGESVESIGYQKGIIFFGLISPRMEKFLNGML